MNYGRHCFDRIMHCGITFHPLIFQPVNYVFEQYSNIYDANIYYKLTNGAMFSEQIKSAIPDHIQYYTVYHVIVF